MSLSTALTYQPKEIVTQPSLLRNAFQSDTIPDEGVLKKALEECHATSLSFVDMFLSQESMHILAESLPGHSESLRQLSLSRCGARGSSVIAIFSNLSLCRNLTTLHLASCGLTPTSMYSLCNTVLRGCTQLRELDVSDNPLKDEGVNVLTMLLTHETSPIQITSLGLSSVLVTDGLRVAQTLMKIPSLTNVDLSGNPIDTRDPEVRAAMLALDRTLRRQYADGRGGSVSGKTVWTPPDASEIPRARLSTRVEDVSGELEPSQLRQFSKPTASPSIAPGGRGGDHHTASSQVARPLRLMKVDAEKKRSSSTSATRGNLASISPRLFATNVNDGVKRLGLSAQGPSAYHFAGGVNRPRAARGLSNSPTRRTANREMGDALLERRTPTRKPPVPVLSPRRTAANDEPDPRSSSHRRTLLLNATPRYCFGKRVADLSSHPSPAFVQPMHRNTLKVKSETSDCTLSYAYDDPRDIGYIARHGTDFAKQPSAVFRYSEKRGFGLSLASTPGPGAYHNPALLSSIAKRGVSPSRLHPTTHSFGRSQRIIAIHPEATAVPGPGAYDTHTF